MTWALAVLVFASAVVIDYAHARYARARDAGRRWPAVAWGTLQYGAASIGFVAAVTVSVWLLPFEAAGLALGTAIAVKPR